MFMYQQQPSGYLRSLVIKENDGSEASSTQKFTVWAPSSFIFPLSSSFYPSPYFPFSLFKIYCRLLALVIENRVEGDRRHVVQVVNSANNHVT